MDATPKISVLIPFYNAESTLAACLESVSRSKYGNFEVICIDDRSTDGSAGIAAKHEVRLAQMIRRSGAAAARNLAASLADGEIFFFMDADVLAPSQLLSDIAARFAAEPELDAVFGAYTRFPAEQNFTSIYKNLVHHYTHLTSKRHASTFWCGCGAIRREAFRRVGGFDESYNAASVEDIELGYRLSKQGGRIRLDPTLQVTHAKRYTFTKLIRSDLLDRAIPWTKLMARENVFTLDLNLKPANVLSGVLLAMILPVTVAMLLLFPLSWSIYFFAAVILAYLVLNGRIFLYALRARGPFFLVLFIGMYSFTYLYSVLGFALGLVIFVLERRKS